MHQRVLVVGSFASGSEIARLVASTNLSPIETSDASSNGIKATNGTTNEYHSDIVHTTATNGDQEDHSAKKKQSGSTPAQPLTPTPTQSQSHTPVFVSSSGEPNLFTAQHGDPQTPWVEHITYVPLISHLTPPTDSNPRGLVHFHPFPSATSATPEAIEVDTIIFATGYNTSLPFFKASDEPWKCTKVLDGVIGAKERDGGDESEVGGMKGLTMKELDESLLFLKGDGDRSLAFPVLREYPLACDPTLHLYHGITRPRGSPVDTGRDEACGARLRCGGTHIRAHDSVTQG